MDVYLLLLVLYSRFVRTLGLEEFGNDIRWRCSNALELGGVDWYALRFLLMRRNTWLQRFEWMLLIWVVWVEEALLRGIRAGLLDEGKA